jgi:hypothetical protein
LRDKGILEKLIKILIDNPNCQWLMIDTSTYKVHPHAADTEEGNQATSGTIEESTHNYIRH